MPRGGKRPGAGRPKGAVNKETAAQRATLSELAREHTDIALKALVDVATRGSDAAKVSAAIALLDRGYGKPVQEMDHTSSDGSMKPQVIELVAVQSANSPSGEDGGEL